MALRRPVAFTPPVPRLGPRISAREWRWLAIVAGILLLATVPPILIAARQVPSGQVFPGYVVIARDAYVYQALWHAGAAGDWLFRSRYTAEPLPGVLLYPWYLWSGHLLGGLPSAWLYHATRLLAAGALAVATYGLAAELYRSVILRRWAFLLAVLGGGIGLVVPAVHLGPVAARATETLSPGSSVADLVAMAPHLSLAMALMCAIFVAALRMRRGGSWALLATGLAAVVALQLIYPQLALLAALVIAAWSAIRRLGRPLLFAVSSALIQAPYLVYLVSVARSHSLALATVRSALDVGDPFGFLVLSHLVATMLLLLGLLTRRLRGDLILPCLWIVGMTLFMFTPGISATLGRSFMASSIPFGLCAIPGLVVVLRRLRTPRWRRRTLSAMMAVAGFYGLVSLAQPIWIAALRLDPMAEYENGGEARLLARLAPRVSSRDLILTTYLDGLFVPAQTNARVYAGHPDMTIDAPRKATEALDFFQSWAADRRDGFLRANGIDFVLTNDPGAVTRLEGDPALRVADRDGSSALFQVTP